MLSDNKIKELDSKLIELAIADFEAFCRVTKVDKQQAYICMQTLQGKSCSTIARMLSISKQAVSRRVKSC